MRTRQQVRNFGHDLTNNQPARNTQNLLVELKTLSKGEKLAQWSQNHISHSTFCRKSRQPKKIQKFTEQTLLQQRLEEIMIFGNDYYQKMLNQKHYLSDGNADNIEDYQNQSQTIGCTGKQQEKQKNGKVVIFSKSPHLTVSMRNILIQWIIQVHHKMCLRYETLYLTIFLIDQFCTKKFVAKNQYQLLGMASLFIAGKYQQVATPKLKRIMALCDDLYQITDVLDMQSQILIQLNFKISQPLLNWFISLNLFAIQVQIRQSDQRSIVSTALNPKGLFDKFTRWCNYLTELCLFQIQILQKFSPHIICNTVTYVVSMLQPFLNIDIKCNTEYLSAGELRQMRQCSGKVRNVFTNRNQTKFLAVNIKYPELKSIDSV